MTDIESTITWKHCLCVRCFFSKWDDQDPTVVDVSGKVCCECGLNIKRGIVFTIAPMQLRCQGIHANE